MHPHPAPDPHVARDAASPDPAHELKRELGLGDLVPMQILLIFGVTWAGYGAQQGGTHIAFWLVGAALFFIPSAAVVGFCVQLWPQEGGVYQWVRHTFGPFLGFLSAWNFAVWAILQLSSIGIQTATSLAYGLGAAWMSESQPLFIGLTVGIWVVMAAICMPGFGIGRWVSHFGTTVMVLVTLLLIVLLIWHPHSSAAHPHMSPQRPFDLHFPLLTLLSINLFTKITFNSYTGIEQVAVFAGETRDPARSILRSVWVAAPIIVLIYVLSTGSILTYVPAAQVDLTGPLPQVLAAAFKSGKASRGGVDLGTLLSRTTILALAVALIAQYAVVLAETSRLPLVAGWDRIVPHWFTQLHPRWGTPTRSILAMSAVGLAAGLLAIAGAGKQEAFQMLIVAANLSYAIYFCLLFLIPLCVGRRFGAVPSLWCKVGACCGLLITLTAMGFGLIPIVPVASVALFAGKVFVIGVLVNLAGALVYRQGVRRSAAPATLLQAAD